MIFRARVEMNDMEFVATRFRAAVLPQDKELETALFYRLDRKRCCVRRTVSAWLQVNQRLMFKGTQCDL